MALPGNWELQDLLTLHFSKHLDSIKLKKIVENFTNLKSAFELGHDKAIQSDLFNSNFDEERKLAENCLANISQNEYRIVTIWDEDYPILLKQVAAPPIILYVSGNLQDADSSCISIVGTRRCSLYGKDVTERLVESLVHHQIVIVSGLAQGIDTEAHLATLKHGGITYAVIASGLDKVSPSISKMNADRILDSGGAVISEYPPGINAKPGYFPQRNRIISGISLATIVVESKEKGGSLITANFAFDQQREVFAVPGDIRSEKSKGTNYLIKKQIAIPALSGEQILQDLGLIQSSLNFEKAKPIDLADEIEKVIFENISYDPIQIDQLSEISKVDISTLLVKLLGLEFKGIVRQLPGKNYIRI